MSTDDSENGGGSPTVQDLVQQAEDLSEMALRTGNPKASALITLAVMEMRKKVA